jgi:hypothetical protein
MTKTSLLQTEKGFMDLEIVLFISYKKKETLMTCNMSLCTHVFCVKNFTHEDTLLEMKKIIDKSFMR